MNNELQHHGILGMKWGVRRYQNEDGSYTKKGLERYSEAKAKYDQADAGVKSAKASGQDTKAARAGRKAAKKELNKAYDQLKLDQRADRGKRTYQQGDTIESIATRRKFTQIGTAVGGNVIAVGLQYAANTFNKPALAYAAKATSAATIAATWIEYGIGQQKIKNLRAYYGHSRG